jgi:hypothetical protein
MPCWCDSDKIPAASIAFQVRLAIFDAAGRPNVSALLISGGA